MIPTREQAWDLLCEYNEGEFHRLHARIVGDVMRYFAAQLGYADEADFWQTVGILHDLDFEQYPDQHCTKEAQILRERGVDERLVHAVVSHGYLLTVDVQPEHQMEKVLYAKIGSSGDSAQIGSSGDYAQIGSSGDSAKIGSSGNSAQIGSSGNYAKINSTGEDSVICCAGSGSVVKAKAGSWITLAEWEYSDEKGRFAPRCVKTEYVDGEKIKADTWYRLKNGEFEEVR